MGVIEELGRYLEYTNQVSMNTISRNFFEWAKNLKENLPVIWESKDLEDMPKISGSAVVVGAGPSLKKNVRLLSRYEGDVLVCERALREVTKYVEPDYVVCIDHKKKIADFFRRANLEKCDNSVGIFCCSVHPDVLKVWGDREKYFMNAAMAKDHSRANVDMLMLTPQLIPTANVDVMINLLTGKTSYYTGGNVGTFAWLVAANKGANPIGLIGMDMSSPKATREFRIPLNGFYTNEVYMTYLRYFIVQAQAYAAEKKVKTVNCTEGGVLYSKDIEKMRFEEFVRKYGNRD